MDVANLLKSLRQEVSRRAYIRRLDLLEQTPSLLKARLYIAPELFIQVYRNDRFDTTNLVLIHNGQRLYARDQLGGNWHRHNHTAPDQHDTSPAGQKPVTLPEFLDEVEMVLAAMGLP
jgi:hypothetical protein